MAELANGFSGEIALAELGETSSVMGEGTLNLVFCWSDLPLLDVRPGRTGSGGSSLRSRSLFVMLLCRAMLAFGCVVLVVSVIFTSPILASCDISRFTCGDVSSSTAAMASSNTAVLTVLTEKCLSVLADGMIGFANRVASESLFGFFALDPLFSFDLVLAMETIVESGLAITKCRPSSRPLESRNDLMSKKISSVFDDETEDFIEWMALQGSVASVDAVFASGLATSCSVDTLRLLLRGWGFSAGKFGSIGESLAGELAVLFKGLS